MHEKGKCVSLLGGGRLEGGKGCYPQPAFEIRIILRSNYNIKVKVYIKTVANISVKLMRSLCNVIHYNYIHKETT